MVAELSGFSPGGDPSVPEEGCPAADRSVPKASTPDAAALTAEAAERAAALKQAGNELFKGGHLEQAIATYAEGIAALEDAPLLAPPEKEQLALLYQNRGLCLFKQGKFEQAAEDCSCAIKLSSSDGSGAAKAVYRRALCFEELQNWPRALQDGMEFAKSDKKLGTALVQRLQQKARAAAKMSGDRSTGAPQALLPQSVIDAINRGDFEKTGLGADGKSGKDGEAATLNGSDAALFAGSSCTTTQQLLCVIREKGIDAPFAELARNHEVAQSLRDLTRSVVQQKASKKSLLAAKAIPLVTTLLKKILDTEVGGIAVDVAEEGAETVIEPSALVAFLRARHKAGETTPGTPTHNSAGSCSAGSSASTAACPSTPAGQADQPIRRPLLAEEEAAALAKMAANAFQFLHFMGNYIWDEDELGTLQDKAKPLPSDAETDTAQEQIRCELPLHELRRLLRVVKPKVVDVAVDFREEKKRTRGGGVEEGGAPAVADEEDVVPAGEGDEGGETQNGEGGGPRENSRKKRRSSHETLLPAISEEPVGEEASSAEELVAEPSNNQQHKNKKPPRRNATHFRFDSSPLVDCESVLENAVRVCYFYSPNTTKTYHGIRGKLEDRTLLDTICDLHDRLQRFENLAAVSLVSQIADERRRMGELAKAYVPTHSFYKLVESMLNSAPVCSDALKTCLAQLWFLLADKERPKKDALDLSEVSTRMILPFVSQSVDVSAVSGGAGADHSLLANGFLSLSTMFYVNAEAASNCLHQNCGKVLNVILKLCYAVVDIQSPETRLAQIYASDVLVHCMRDLSTRTQVLSAGGLEMVMGILKGMKTGKSYVTDESIAAPGGENAGRSDNNKGRSTLQADQTRLLKAKLVCVLALMAAHDADVSCQIFEFVDFMAALEDAFGYMRELSAEIADTRRRLETKVKKEASMHGGGKGNNSNSSANTAATAGGRSDALQSRRAAPPGTAGAGGELRGKDEKPSSKNPFTQLPDERLISLQNENLGAKELLRSLEFDTLLKLKKAFLEAFVYLSMHKDFKEELIKTAGTTSSSSGNSLIRYFLCEFVQPEDIEADSTVGFHYTTIIFNLFRSKEDKVRPRRQEYPYSELDDDQIEELEKFYAKMPDKSKTPVNGMVDAGSRDLALQYRRLVVESADAVCIEKLNQIGSATVGEVVSSAATVINKSSSTSANKAVPSSTTGSGSTTRVRYSLTLQGQMSLCLVYNFLTQNQENLSWRRTLMKKGSVGVLLKLHASLNHYQQNCTTAELKAENFNEKALDACRQALAHIGIVTNPELFTYKDSADLVKPMLTMMKKSRQELHQFEAAMCLTNLASAKDVRDVLIANDGWDEAMDLLFSSNERVQRVGLELMCNLCADERMVDKIAKKCQHCLDGKGVDNAPAEVKVVLAVVRDNFCGFGCFAWLCYGA
eukprot:g2266.t1